MICLNPVVFLRSWRAAIAIATLVVSYPARAHADEDPEALIRQGVQLRKAGDDAKAHGYFRRAYDLAHTPRSAAQLGLVEYALEFWSESESHLYEALGNDSDAWIRGNRAVLEQALADVRRHLCELQITGDPRGARVLVGGKPKGNLPVSVFAPAGAVTVEVEAPDFEPTRRTITLATGAAGKWEVHLRPRAAAAADSEPKVASTAEPSHAAEAPPADRGRDWKRPAAWVAGGVGAALLAGGVVAAVASNKNYQDFNAPKIPGTNDNRCSTALADKGGSDCASSLSAGDRDKALAIGAFIGAAALAATATILAVTAPSRRADGAMAISCVPLVDGQTGGVCAVRF